VSPAAAAWASRALVVIAAIVVYANGLDGAFVFDDVPGIVDRVEHLSAPLLQVVRGERRPLVTLTLAMNHRLGGLDPRGYHALNLAIHVAAVLALLELITLGARRLGTRNARSLATATALLWAVHPLGTESVTYAIQRAEALATLACFIMLYALARASGARGRSAAAWSCGALAACLAGMASKPTMVTAPFLALLFDGLVLSPSLATAWRDRWGLHVALACTWLVPVATGVAGGVLGFGGGPAAVGFGVFAVTPLEYLGSQPEVVLHYARLLVWPDVLCIDRRWPVEEDAAAIATASLVVAVALGLIGVALRRRHPLAFPAAAAVIWLAPTSSFVPLRDLAVEHRTYLPAACAILILAVGGREVLRRIGGQRAGALGAAVVALATGALGWRTIERNRDYATPLTLWTSTLDVVPDNPRAHVNLGAALIEAGRSAEAIDVLESAVAIAPNDARAQLNLGVARLEQGRAREAITPLSLAVSALPGRTEIRAILADALRAAGDREAAMRELRRVYDAAPSALVCLALGNELAHADDLAGAARMFAEAAERADVDGDRRLAASAQYNLGNTRLREGDDQGAAAAYRRAIELDPGHAEARRWLDLVETPDG